MRITGAPGSGGGFDRNAISVPVNDAWQKWLLKYANSPKAIVGSEIDPRTAVLTLSLETLLGIEGGGGNGEGGKVQLVDAQGNPLAVTADDPPVLGVAVAGDVNVGNKVSVELTDIGQGLDSTPGIPVVNKVSDHFQVDLQAVDGGVKVPVEPATGAGNFPVEIAALASTLNPLPVTSSDPRSGRRFYGVGGVHVDSVSNMTAVGVEMVIPANKTIYDLNVRTWMYDDSNGNVNAGWGLFRVGTPQGNWSGTHTGVRWPDGNASTVYLRDPRALTGAANFVGTTLYETFVTPTPLRSATQSSTFGVILIGQAGPFPKIESSSTTYLCWGFNDVNGNNATGDVVAFSADWWE